MPGMRDRVDPERRRRMDRVRRLRRGLRAPAGVGVMIQRCIMCGLYRVLNAMGVCAGCAQRRGRVFEAEDEGGA